MNLQNELNQVNKRNTESNEIKKEVLLLENTSQEERNILRSAGLSGMFDEIDQKQAVRITRLKAQEDFNTTLYTLDEIKDLCIKYRLRFLHSRDFKGKIDEKLGKKLVEYLKERKVVGTLENEANTNLFILAKKRDFNFDNKNNKRAVNPILFYQVETKEGKMYSIVTKWGRSFGIERLILGIIFKNNTSMIISYIITLVLGFNIIISSCGVNPFTWWNLLITCLACGILFLISYPIFYDIRKYWYRALQSTNVWRTTQSRALNGYYE